MAFIDTLIRQLDGALKTIHNIGTAQRAYPASHIVDASPLSAENTRHAAGLMRVNHVGEVCAQALYAGQLMTARSSAVREFNEHAALEERDHLLWTAQRLKELNAKPSLLNPLWYSASWTMGAVAGLLGDKTSLSFVRETEAQVEAHLHSHETLLPANDAVSLAIVTQMKLDEAAHGAQAQQMGGEPLPASLTALMRLSAKVMTSTAYRI
jgi:ubiquinone biosynthesis monooxygenase Coq7